MDRAAYIMSQVACALIELEAMKAANYQRAQLGQAQEYSEDAIVSLIDKYHLDHNSVIEKLQ